jgi:hypothetical protein
LTRLKENRERFAEDISIAGDKTDIGILDVDNDEDDDSQGRESGEAGGASLT